jgi:hypothetical protein
VNVFFTGVAQGSLGDKANRVYYPMEGVLKEKLGNYGDGLSQWFLLFVILGPGVPGHDAPVAGAD